MQFADGTGWTRSDVLAIAAQNQPAVIIGTVGDDVMDSAGVAAVELGNGGGDTYLFNAGYDSITIANSAPGGGTAGGVPQFGAGLDEAGLWLMQVGQDLVIDLLGSRSSVTVLGWFSDDLSARLAGFQTGDGVLTEARTEGLLHAMAAYAAAHPSFSAGSAQTMPDDTALRSALSAAWAA